jgi:hypothetical protein
MSIQTIPTRRSFLKVGALLAAPMAVPAAAAIGSSGAEARLAEHEDKAEIRDLHRAWLRDIAGRSADAAALIGPGAVLHRIAPDHDAEDAIMIAGDGKSASGRFACTVEIGTELAPDSTLAQMAHAQGEGFVLRTERRTIAADYVKTQTGWTMAGIALTAA